MVSFDHIMQIFHYPLQRLKRIVLFFQFWWQRKAFGSNCVTEALKTKLCFCRATFSCVPRGTIKPRKSFASRLFFPRLFAPIFLHYFSQFVFLFLPLIPFPFSMLFLHWIWFRFVPLIFGFIFPIYALDLPACSGLIAIVIGSFNLALERWSCASRFASY